MTTQEAAEFLNVSRPFLIRQLKSGELPYRHVGKHHRIRCDDLLDYQGAMRSPSGTRHAGLSRLLRRSETLLARDAGVGRQIDRRICTMCPTLFTSQGNS